MIQITVNSDLSENVTYNRSGFPAYIKRGTLSDYPDFRAVCHWHTDFEFIYVFDGEMDYSVNDTILTLKSGQGVFINSNCLHYGFSNSRTECHFLCVLLHPDLLTSNTFFRETILDSSRFIADPRLQSINSFRKKEGGVLHIPMLVLPS